MLALLLGVAVYRTVLAGCPEDHNMSTLACLFLPTHTDLGIHLLSYAFSGTILLGIFSWLVLWCRQWTKMRQLTSNLAQLRVTGYSEARYLLREVVEEEAGFHLQWRPHYGHR